MAGWNADAAAGPMGPQSVTLVQGSSFCISFLNGDIHSELPQGLFIQDTRVLSGWSLTVNGQPLEPLAAETKEPYRELSGAGVPKALLARDYGISRDTVCQYLRHAKLE